MKHTETIRRFQLKGLSLIVCAAIAGWAGNVMAQTNETKPAQVADAKTKKDAKKADKADKADKELTSSSSESSSSDTLGYSEYETDFQSSSYVMVFLLSLFSVKKITSMQYMQ